VLVTGGDTIVVHDANDTQHKIRLQGNDSPERGQAYGTKSKEHLSDSVAGEIFVVEYDKYDRYGLVLGKALLGGEDINLEQVRAGLAWHYKKYQGEQTVTDRVAYSDAEMEARMHNIGLWGDPAPIPDSPWAGPRAPATYGVVTSGEVQLPGMLRSWRPSPPRRRRLGSEFAREQFLMCHVRVPVGVAEWVFGVRTASERPEVDIIGRWADLALR